MALRGTLKDFGIADILQLIGHQAKTGTLTVKNRNEAVMITLNKGQVAGAEMVNRRERNMLGTMLVRAELLSDDELPSILEAQKESGKRLGDVLVEQGYVEREILRTMVKLQTTETIYGLFHWSAGSYEFIAKDVEVDPDAEPMRSESVLMEGFRQVDEWPPMRSTLQSYDNGFSIIEDLHALLDEAGDDDDDEFNLDDAFGGFGDDADDNNNADADDFGESKSKKDPRLSHIGDNEKTLFALINPERDIQKLIDLSLLGEFETCKALTNLLKAKMIALVPGVATPRKGDGRWHSAFSVAGGTHWKRVGVSLVLMLVLVSLGWIALQQIDLGNAVVATTSQSGYIDRSLNILLADGQMQIIHYALSVYHARYGKYPKSLNNLRQFSFINEDTLHFPWRSPYLYQPTATGYRLSAPIE